MCRFAALPSMHSEHCSLVLQGFPASVLRVGCGGAGAALTAAGLGAGSVQRGGLRPSADLLPPKTVIASGAGPGLSQRPGTPARSPMWVAVTPKYEPPSAFTGWH